MKDNLNEVMWFAQPRCKELLNSLQADEDFKKIILADAFKLIPESYYHIVENGMSEITVDANFLQNAEVYSENEASLEVKEVTFDEAGNFATIKFVYHLFDELFMGNNGEYENQQDVDVIFTVKMNVFTKEVISTDIEDAYVAVKDNAPSCDEGVYCIYKVDRDGEVIKEEYHNDREADGLISEFAEMSDDDLYDAYILGYAQVEPDGSVRDYHISERATNRQSIIDALARVGVALESDTQISPQKNVKYVKVPEGVGVSTETMDNDITQEPVSEPIRQDTAVSMLSELIKDEWSTVKAYESAITFFTEASEFKADDGQVKVLQDIRNEEYVHIGQLQKLLESFANSADHINKGIKEGEGQLENTLDSQRGKDEIAEESVTPKKLVFKKKSAKESADPKYTFKVQLTRKSDGYISYYYVDANSTQEALDVLKKNIDFNKYKSADIVSRKNYNPYD